MVQKNFSKNLKSNHSLISSFNKKSLFLPTSKKELEEKGFDYLDVVLITGDAYVDHPSFGAALVGRYLESLGLRVGIVARPNVTDDLRDFKKLGVPRLFFGVTSGAVDSMVSNYTSFKKIRSLDQYAPNGSFGMRPDDATIKYSNILKSLFPDTPIVIGGIEASLRRFPYYDYWSDSLRTSIAVDSKSDLLVYGMGEVPLNEMVSLLQKGVPFSSLKTVSQTAYVIDDLDKLPKNKNWEDVFLHDLKMWQEDKAVFSYDFKVLEKLNRPKRLVRIIQKLSNNKYSDKCGEKYLVVNPITRALSSGELDALYSLPFTYLPHPRYLKQGKIPAYEMIKFSICAHRGCLGGCSFCSINMHQGREIVSRSEKSIIQEIEKIKKIPDFKGHITDVGGPSANMYGFKYRDKSTCEKCTRPSCLHPKICPNIDTSHRASLDLLDKILKIEGVTLVTIGSGIRYDLFIGKDACDLSSDKFSNKEYLEKIFFNHISGYVKVAPEHFDNEVLNLMRKPPFELFVELCDKIKLLANGTCKSLGIDHDRIKRSVIVPYLISNHPGCSEKKMYQINQKFRALGIELRQVQSFTPTPLTFSTSMYYSNINPYANSQYTKSMNLDSNIETDRNHLVQSIKDVDKKKQAHQFFFSNSSRKKS